jgi:hypothetical protein
VNSACVLLPLRMKIGRSQYGRFEHHKHVPAMSSLYTYSCRERYICKHLRYSCPKVGFREEVWRTVGVTEGTGPTTQDEPLDEGGAAWKFSPSNRRR